MGDIIIIQIKFKKSLGQTDYLSQALSQPALRNLGIQHQQLHHPPLPGPWQAHVLCHYKLHMQNVHPVIPPTPRLPFSLCPL